MRMNRYSPKGLWNTVKRKYPAVFRQNFTAETFPRVLFPRSLLPTLSKIRNKRPRSESKRWHKHRIFSGGRNSDRTRGWSCESQDREERGRAVRKIAKIYVPGILRMDAPSARNSSCPSSSMLLQLQCPWKPFRGDGYVFTYAVPIFRPRAWL